MSHALLLVPDFLLILCGFVLCRWTRAGPQRLGRRRAAGVLPAVPGAAVQLDPEVAAAAGRDARPGARRAWPWWRCGIVLAYALRLWPGVDARLHASGAQTAFRFNSFIALALAERLAGPQGLAWIALLIALCVPLCNVAAVWPLARHGGHGYLRELVRNPLILATVAGLLANLAGLRLARCGGHRAAAHRPGRAAAGPDGGGRGPEARRAARTRPAWPRPCCRSAMRCCRCWPSACACGWRCRRRRAWCWWPSPRCPPRPSAYVLAVRMGGHGPFVAGLVTVSTLLVRAQPAAVAGGAGGWSAR